MSNNINLEERMRAYATDCNFYIQFGEATSDRFLYLVADELERLDSVLHLHAEPLTHEIQFFATRGYLPFEEVERTVHNSICQRYNTSGERVTVLRILQR